MAAGVGTWRPLSTGTGLSGALAVIGVLRYRGKETPKHRDRHLRSSGSDWRA